MFLVTGSVDGARIGSGEVEENQQAALRPSEPGAGREVGTFPGMLRDSVQQAWVSLVQCGLNSNTGSQTQLQIRIFFFFCIMFQELDYLIADFSVKALCNSLQKMKMKGSFFVFFCGGDAEIFEMSTYHGSTVNEKC